MSAFQVIALITIKAYMLDHIDISKVLFLDIETVPQFPSYDQLPERMQKLWDDKAGMLRERSNGKVAEDDNLYHRAGIYAEFGKIVCICTGHIVGSQFRMRSFHGDNEREILVAFSDYLSGKLTGSGWFLCAHNGKEFDFPYISRRMLIQSLSLPAILQNAGKKPWEVRHLDTMELWKFGDFKNYTSLNLLSMVFDIPSPKGDISGADVHKVYYMEHDIERIVHYCLKDTLAVAQVFCRIKGIPVIEEPENNVVLNT